MDNISLHKDHLVKINNELHLLSKSNTVTELGHVIEYITNEKENIINAINEIYITCVGNKVLLNPDDEKLIKSLHENIVTLSKNINSPVLTQKLNEIDSFAIKLIQLIDNEPIQKQPDYQSLELYSSNLPTGSTFIQQASSYLAHPESPVGESLEENILNNVRQERELKLASLKKQGQHEFVSAFRSLEKDFASFKATYKGKDFFEVEEEVIAKYQEINDNYPQFHFVQSGFESITDSFIDEKSRGLWQEVIINQIVNEKFYLKQVETFLDLNKDKIVQKLTGNTHAKNEIQLQTIKISTAEGHNQGKKIIFATFEIGGQVLKCVVKPRSALLDQLVLKAFDEINNLPRSERSADDTEALPTYRIIEPVKEENWEYLEAIGSVSIWEYVEGDTVEKKLERVNDTRAHARSVRDYIEMYKVDEKNKERLRRLDAILHKLGISDQHIQNIIENELERLIPVDLEARGRPTELLNSSSRTSLALPPYQLTTREIEKIEEINTQMHTVPARIVLIKTSQLNFYLKVAMGNLENPEAINLIFSNLSERYKIVKDEASLIKQIKAAYIQDILNFDIPYFTELNGTIYYGLPERGIALGKVIGEENYG